MQLCARPVLAASCWQVICTARTTSSLCRTRSWGQPARRSGSLACWAQRSLNEPPTSRRVVWVAARHADHPSAAGAVRHKVKGDRDGEYAYVRDACVERALTCRRRSMLPRMLTRTCFALPGRLQEHPNDYCVQLLYPGARLGAQGAARGTELQERDRGRWLPPY